MGVIENAVNWAIEIANDDSHWYSQEYRWGPHYDCSSFVISAYDSTGVKDRGATYTGNMYSAFINSGFSDVTNQVNLETGEGLHRGDVLLNTVHHTAISLGDGTLVHASSSKNGILVRSYYNYPWNFVLRYNESNISNTSYPEPTRLIKKGCQGTDVKWVQEAINRYIFFNCEDKDYLDVDGIAGSKTELKIKGFQWLNGLTIDGIVGTNTREKMRPLMNV